MIINDIKTIYLPVCLILIALYIPIFFLSIFNLSKKFLIIPIIIYLLLIPTYSLIRNILIFNTCIASIAIYYSQKICEWILFRKNEFEQWSFFDIQHELFYYRIYTQTISIKKFQQKKKEIFFTGPIQYNQHLNSLIYLTYNIIKYYFLLDLIIYLLNEIFTTNIYEKYFLFRILINQTSGCIVYLFLMFNYEIFRYILCLFFNRPLKLIPELFRQPYRAISPSDFWLRWHQIFRDTWIELIFKPILKFIQYHWPILPKFISYSISTISVFIFSGIVHEYAVYITFNKFSGDQIKFFFLQGLAVILEYVFKQKFSYLSIPKSIGFLSTFIFNGITSGYFLKPWLSYFQKKQKFKYSIINFIVQNFFNKSFCFF